MGLPYASIRYAGRQFDAYPNFGETELDLVVTVAAGRMVIYQKGVVRRDEDGLELDGPPGVWLGASGCAPDLGGATMHLDKLTIEAR